MACGFRLGSGGGWLRTAAQRRAWRAVPSGDRGPRRFARWRTPAARIPGTCLRWLLSELGLGMVSTCGLCRRVARPGPILQDHGLRPLRFDRFREFPSFSTQAFHSDPQRAKTALPSCSGWSRPGAMVRCRTVMASELGQALQPSESAFDDGELDWCAWCRLARSIGGSRWSASEQRLAFGSRPRNCEPVPGFCVRSPFDWRQPMTYSTIPAAAGLSLAAATALLL